MCLGGWRRSFAHRLPMLGHGACGPERRRALLGSKTTPAPGLRGHLSCCGRACTHSASGGRLHETLDFLEIGPGRGAGVWAYFVRRSKTTRVSFYSKASAAPGVKPERRCCDRRGDLVSAPRGHFQFRANMHRDLARVVVDEMPDAVMRDAAELGPFAQRAHRRLFPGRKDAAGAQADNVGEPVLDRRG